MRTCPPGTWGQLHSTLSPLLSNLMECLTVTLWPQGYTSGRSESYEQKTPSRSVFCITPNRPSTDPPTRLHSCSCGYSHGGVHGEKVETSASVCLRPVLPGRGLCASGSSFRPWPCLTSSLMVVSSRLLGDTDRCRNTPLQLASTGKSKGYVGQK